MTAPSQLQARASWDKGLAIAGIGVVVLFLLALAYVLLRSDGAAGHGGGGPTMGAHGGNMTGAMSHGQGSMRSTQTFFGLVALAGSAAYLTALAAWSKWRGKSAFLVRHVATASAMLVLVVLYLNARGSFEYNGHNWNRSFADASVVLYAVTLGIGPLARLWRPAARALEWRRETGIWATIAAIIHVGIFWEWSFGWGSWRLFVYPSSDGEIANTLLGDRASGLRAGAFELANVIGLVALAYALVLTITSNDASQRWLKSGWSWLMKRATTMQILVLLHTWLFAYYLTHEQSLPIGTLWASFWAVLLLQTLAFAKTAWLRGRAGAPAPGT